jgi:hypothetical protein
MLNFLNFNLNKLSGGNDNFISDDKQYNKLNFSKFNFNKIYMGGIIFIISENQSDKLLLVNNILYYLHNDVPVGTIITLGENINNNYKNIIPDKFIYNEYNSEIIDNYIKRQRYITKTKFDEYNKFNKSYINPYAFLLIDNCEEKNINDCRSMYQLFCNSRSYRSNTIITLQNNYIKPSIRGNVDYVFIFPTDDIKIRKNTYEQYGGMFKSFEIFSQVMDSIEKFECLVIDNTTKSNKIEDIVYSYKLNKEQILENNNKHKEIWRSYDKDFEYVKFKY